MLLDKVGKEKDECRDLNSQLKHCINDLKISMCTMKETLISYSCWNEIAENQTKNLILLLSELQCKLNSQPCRMFRVNVKTLIGKKWDTKSWIWDLWETLMNLETLSSYILMSFLFLWKRLLLCIDSATWTSSRLTWLQPPLSIQCQHQ